MWYIIYNGQQVGPLDKFQLRNYNLTPASMVWHEGMPDWQPAGNVPELQEVMTPPSYEGAGGQAEPRTPQRVAPPRAGGYRPRENYDSNPPSGKKVAAGVLAILLGGLGIQYFYIGKVGGGFITILLTLVTCGLWEIITFIQGIIMLTMSDQEFDRKFIYTKSTFPLF